MSRRSSTLILSISNEIYKLRHSYLDLSSEMRRPSCFLLSLLLDLKDGGSAFRVNVGEN
jgi:hypothetical protein